MPQKVMGTCLNHPGFEATARCKQCNKPICNTCQTKGPTGIFCSEECKEKHEAFIKRAHQIENLKKPSSFKLKLGILLGKLLAVVVLLAGVVTLAILFDIPVLSDLVNSAKEAIGL